MSDDWVIPLDDQEQLLMYANVIRFLVDGNEIEAADALLTCSITIYQYMTLDLDYDLNPYAVCEGIIAFSSKLLVLLMTN